MAKKPLPTPDQLRQLLRYEPDTGKLYWRPRTPDMFYDGGHATEHQCAKWNSRFADKEAFTSTTKFGYRQSNLRWFGRVFLAHRVIWAMHYGEWPNVIDHINGDRSDNRIKNLRNVDQAINTRNNRLDHRNKSGVSGVRKSIYKTKTSWIASIGCEPRVHLGSFPTKEEAIAARRRAEIELGYLPNRAKAKTAEE